MWEKGNPDPALVFFEVPVGVIHTHQSQAKRREDGSYPFTCRAEPNAGQRTVLVQAPQCQFLAWLTLDHQGTLKRKFPNSTQSNIVRTSGLLINEII